MAGVHSEYTQPLWVLSVEGDCEQTNEKKNRMGIARCIESDNLKCSSLSYK